MKIAFLEGRYAKPKTTLTLQGEPEALGVQVGATSTNYFKSCTFHLNTSTNPILEFTLNSPSNFVSKFVPQQLEIYHVSINRASNITTTVGFGGLNLGHNLNSPNQTVCSEDFSVLIRSPLNPAASGAIALPLKMKLDPVMHEGDIVRIYLRLYIPYVPPPAVNLPRYPNPIGDIEKYSNNNVLFLFPHHSQPPRQLWANKDHLIISSTYFKGLFASGFSESEKTFSITALPSNLFEIPSIDKDEYFSDSDSEDSPAKSPQSDMTIYRIIIRETSYKTYKALLYYLVHGKIFFGTLSSAKAITPSPFLAPTTTTATTSIYPTTTTATTSIFPTTTTATTSIFPTTTTATTSIFPTTVLPALNGTTTSPVAFATFAPISFGASSNAFSAPILSSASPVPLFQPQPQVPTPSEILKQSLTVSPKSIYRLAHQLDLSELKKLALQSFTSQLSSRNVIVELFSEFSMCYDECRKSAWKVAKTDWENVVKSKGMGDLERGIESGEIVGRRASLAIELMKQLRV